MTNQIIEATTDVRTNILMAADFLKEQKRLLYKQSLEMEKLKIAKNEKATVIHRNSEGIELKGKEKELLIEEVENLLKIRMEKDVVLIETGQDSNRYIRCMYVRNRQTLQSFLEDFVEACKEAMPDDMQADPIQSLFQLLHEKKILKKNFKPYSGSVAKGFFEEKPSRILIDANKNAVRVETDAYITAAGANRLRLKELKPILRVANSI